MKLHLPVLLRRSLLALTAFSAVLPTVMGGTLSSEIDLSVYADFGQNRGRYSTSNVNALLQHLNAGGVRIYYNNGKDAYKLEHGMISFDSRQEDNGASAAVNYNFIATVAHNGVQNPYFSYLELGAEHAIQYKGIEYRNPNVFDNGVDGAFIHSAPNSSFQADFKMTRLSKVVTDVSTSSLYSSEKVAQGMIGQLLYRSGGGYSDVIDPSTGVQTSIERLITGAIQQIDGNGIAANGNFWMGHTADGWNTDVDPLPFGVNSGDSGSPVWVWDAEEKEYRYLGAVALEDSNPANGTTKGNLKFAEEVIDSYNKTVSSSSSVINLSATSQTNQVVTQGEVSTTLWQGQATDADGNVLATYNGVQAGVNTWKDMTAIRDLDNWYAETEGYLNASQNNTAEGSLDYADLFVTDNLVFSAVDRSDYTVQVDAELDLGIGYTEFTVGNQKSASYTVKGSGYLDSAGYIIGEGAEVHLQLVSDDRTRELRKIGAGNLHIDGTGNNDILLNVGGSGTTYLNQKDGYAAYNVLINNGAAVVLQGGISQVKRDVTFGNGGGVLDFAGESWTEGAEGNFSLKALTQDAVLANTKANSVSELTFTKGGTFVASFRDTEDAALQVRYAGEDTLTLNSIHTDLRHAQSGLWVDKGTVVLVGTNTKHAAANLSGSSVVRSETNDWHYADASMNVTVADGAVFELGSHARLTGTVTAEAGGTYIMREGVQQQWEYIEGGYATEDTYAIRDFYGHHGDTVLNGGTLSVEFSEGTTADMIYTGNITGSGSMTVNTAEGSLSLTGTNTFSGSKVLSGGHLIASHTSALGTGEGWQIAAETVLTVQSGLTSANLLSYVDKDKSAGILALGNDVEHAVDLGDSALIIGAEAGKTVSYGSSSDSLAASRLGGGGGTLEVGAKLTGSQNLVLGQEGTSGTVRLTNAANDFSGTITMLGAVSLDYTSVAALGNATLNLEYGKGVMLRGSAAELSSHLAEGSRGAFLLDYCTESSVDMSGMGEISLSAAGNAAYNGRITVGEGESYRLGGYVGHLSLGQNALSGNHALVVDAKGTEGGQVSLAAQTEYTGAVTVQDGSPEQSGQVTLRLAETDALKSASSTTVGKGGTLLLSADTTQTLTNLQVAEGGLLQGETGSTIVFNMTDERYQNGAMQLDKAEKIGSANLVLVSTDNEWNLFTVKQGTLFTRVDNALSASGVTRVEKGATLNLNTWNGGTAFTSRTMHGNILLADGAVMVTGTDSYDVTLTGTFGVESGATAQVNGGKWHLTGLEYNKNGGTVSFSSDGLYLDNAQHQRIGGTVDITRSTSFYSTQSAENMLKQFNHVSIGSGKTLKLEDTTWNTIWQFDKLTGEGELVWNSDTTYSATARVILDGDGEFGGTITVNRSYDQSARAYQAFVEIRGDKAVSAAAIQLNGGMNVTYPANACATLAINTENAHIGSLSGNSYSHLMSGAAPGSSASTVASPPVSTALNTLTITGSGDAVFSGTVAGDASNGLHLVHAGSGTQGFNGSSVVWHDVTAKGGGTLDFSGATALQVLGNVSIGQNSSLNLGQHSMSLDAGKTLSITGAGAAMQTSELVLNGGTLVFDASVAEGAFSLTGSISSSSGATVNFTGLSASLIGSSMTLASGDWSSVLGELQSANLSYLKATFSTDSNGYLVVSFAQNGYLWGGTAAETVWSSSSFGAESGAPNKNSNVAFNDSAQNSVISVDGYVAAGHMYFENNSSEYVLNDAGGSQITTGSITQSGTGKTTIDAWTVINSALAVQGGELVLNDADLNGGSVSVANGKLSLAIGEKETASSLDLQNGASLELSGGRTLTVNNGSAKNITSELELAAIGAKSILQDVKSDYAVNGGTLTVGNGTADGTVMVKSAQLSHGGTLQVKSGVLASKEGVSFGAGDSRVLLDGGQLVMAEGVKLSAPAEGTAQVTVQNGGALYAGGSEASENLSIELKDGATLGTAAAMADYAGDITLHDGEVTISSGMKYLNSSNSVYSSSYVPAHVRLSGNLSSAGRNANLTVSGTGYGSVLLSGSAQVSGKVTVNAGETLRLAGSMKEQNFEYTQTEGVQISGNKSGSAAVISGGSTLFWDTSSGAGIIGTASGSTRLDNALLTLKDGASLHLQNVILNENSAIKAEDLASVRVNNVQLNVDISSASDYEMEQSLTLRSLVGDETHVMAAGSRVLQLDSSVLQGSITLTGKGLHLNLAGYNVRDYDAVRVSLGSGVDYSEALADVTAAFAVGNPLARSQEIAVFSGWLSADGSLYFASVPEPATATLSLLALAALASRRRRR